jgi:hypothetical protein
MDNEKIDLKLILLIVAIVLSLIALIWVGVVSAKISTFDKKISDTQTAVASLTSYMASTTSVLNERMTQVERLEMTQQSTISSLTSYFKNMYSDLSGKIIAEDQKINNTQSNLTSLTNQVGNLLTSLQSLSTSSQSSQPSNTVASSVPSSGANPIMMNATQSLNSSISLKTITATSLSAVSSIVSNVNAYEITPVNGIYYLAYPGSGVTYSIQVLSSPYPDRVLSLVKALRSAGVPAFKIDYSTQSGLFIGVFPDYTSATNYANAISNSTVTSIVGSGASSWLARQIP